MGERVFEINPEPGIAAFFHDCPADVAESVRTAGRFGIRAELLGADWPAIRDRVFDRLDHDAENGLEYRRRGVDVYGSEARFVEPRVLEVDGQRVRGERVLVAAGSRPTVPDIAGLADRNRL